MIQDIHDAEYHVNNATSKVITSENSNIKKFLTDEKITTIIFSPPYANSFDYFEIFILELWMGQFVHEYSDLRKLRKRGIGTLWQDATPLKCPEELVPTLDLLNSEELWSKKIKNMLITYFSKMDNTIQNCYETLQNNGKCVIVIGNSAYGNILIPTDLIFSNMAHDAGFKNIKINIARHLTTSSQQKKNLEPLKEYLRESILVLEK